MAKSSVSLLVPAKLSPEDMERGIRRLEKRLKQVEDFDPNSISSSHVELFTGPIEQSIETAIIDTFGNHSLEYSRFRDAFNWYFPVGFHEISIGEYRQAASVARAKAIQLITSAIELLRERLEEVGPPVSRPENMAPTAKRSNRIFVVHGHDEAVKESVARFIERLGYSPVVLHEQPNKGRTIIQKFQEEASDVGFAVILMTPDDVTKDGEHRARQNVVLELGFFLGRLGPSRVAAIVKGSLQKPSDFDGVLYIPYDANWKSQLATEMKAAGYEIDWNVVMA